MFYGTLLNIFFSVNVEIKVKAENGTKLLNSVIDFLLSEIDVL